MMGAKRVRRSSNPLSIFEELQFINTSEWPDEGRLLYMQFNIHIWPMRISRLLQFASLSGCSDLYRVVRIWLCIDFSILCNFDKDSSCSIYWRCRSRVRRVCKLSAQKPAAYSNECWMQADQCVRLLLFCGLIMDWVFSLRQIGQKMRCLCDCVGFNAIVDCLVR